MILVNLALTYLLLNFAPIYFDFLHCNFGLQKKKKNKKLSQHESDYLMSYLINLLIGNNFGHYIILIRVAIEWNPQHTVRHLMIITFSKYMQRLLLLYHSMLKK
jgi:hypothetical protein